MYDNAFLFCALNKSNNIQSLKTKLTTETIRRIFNSAYKQLYSPIHTKGGRYQTWSAHSARIGAAIDLAERDTGLTQIMHEGT